MVNANQLFEERLKNALGASQFEMIKLNIALEMANERIQELEAATAPQSPVQESE